MRIKRNRLKQYFHKSALPRKDSEGNLYIDYGPASAFSAEIWPAGGKLQSEMYGQKLSYIRNCRVNENYKIAVDDNGKELYIFSSMELREGDGICVNVSDDSDPDYKIIAIRPYKKLYLEMERI